MGTIVLLILTGISFVLTLWRWVAGLRFPLHRRAVIAGPLPGVTFVKPLKGCDAETKECLRSWFLQKHPGPIQILFGVASAEDPVCAVVRELLTEYPAVDAQLVVCPKSLGANAKVSTLQQLEPLIRHPVLLISDADVRVAPDFAAQACQRLRETGAGLVNCFYRLGNPVTAAMEWEAVAINADFWTQVLQARAVQPIDFALGAVMTVSLADLKAAGGFAALSDYLADDNQLGRRIYATGRKIDFTAVVAECRDTPMNWRQVWAHQSRWARTIRVCQPVSFFFSILNNSSVWPLLLLAGAGRRFIWVTAGCVLVRVATALHQSARLLQRRPHWAYFWMPPIKDLLDAAIWAGAFLSNRIIWRGQRYRIVAEGKLVREATG